MEPTATLNPGDTVITLDMDGTMEDPWACCGKRDRMGGSPECRHLRVDTVEKVMNLLAVYPHAKLVILSWRSGLEAVTRTWLGHVGIPVAAVFVPGSADAHRIGATGSGQVGFKVGIVRALAAFDVEVLTSFDDNLAVIDALRAEGIPAMVAPRLATVEPWEWRAGYIGAPKPADRHVFAATPMDLFNADGPLASEVA